MVYSTGKMIMDDKVNFVFINDVNLNFIYINNFVYQRRKAKKLKTKVAKLICID